MNETSNTGHTVAPHESRRGRLLLALLLGVAGLLMVVVLGFRVGGAIEDGQRAAFERGLLQGQMAAQQDLDDAFDRGMGAGVEYQQWFCENEVTP